MGSCDKPRDGSGGREIYSPSTAVIGRADTIRIPHGGGDGCFLLSSPTERIVAAGIVDLSVWNVSLCLFGRSMAAGNHRGSLVGHGISKMAKTAAAHPGIANKIAAAKGRAFAGVG